MVKSLFECFVGFLQNQVNEMAGIPIIKGVERKALYQICKQKD